MSIKISYAFKPDNSGANDHARPYVTDISIPMLHLKESHYLPFAHLRIQPMPSLRISSTPFNVRTAPVSERITKHGIFRTSYFVLSVLKML